MLIMHSIHRKNWKKCDRILKQTDNPSPQYDQTIRHENAQFNFTFTGEEAKRLLDEGTRHVIRIKMPDNETVSFTDMIRGEVQF